LVQHEPTIPLWEVTHRTTGLGSADHHSLRDYEVYGSRWTDDTNRKSLFPVTKTLHKNIVVSFPDAVRDNIVSHDVTITSSLRSDVILLGINFLFSQ